MTNKKVKDVFSFESLVLRQGSLWWCYACCYWSNFALGGVLKLLGDCVGFIPPLGISVVIHYVSNQTNNTGNVG